MSVDMNIGKCFIGDAVCGNSVVAERSSTRLHAPPGGKTSICFGDYDASTDTNRSKPFVQSTKKTGSMSGILSHDGHDSDEENETKVNRRPTNSSQMTEAMNYESQKPQTSVRVRQAPGGQSSLVLG